MISGKSGIHYLGNNVLGDSTTGAAIVNSGTISAHDVGVNVDHVGTIFGGVSNSGKIVAAVGVAVNSSEVVGTTSAIGGINNSGTITASIDGIVVANGANISGIIGNRGVIIAPTGIFVSASNIDGPIVDSGTIKAASHGILIDSASKILASKTAIAIAGPTFTGGISNFGVISGSAGIEIKAPIRSAFSTPAPSWQPGGTAIQFAGSGNTLTLGAGYIISGIVDPSGNNIFQLGGTGSGSFDLSSIGSGAQYRGFTTFDVVGGAWTVSGAGAATSGWHVDGGTMQLASGTRSPARR